MPEHDRQTTTTSNAPAPPTDAQTEARGPAAMVLALQRTAGNAAVNALLRRRRRIQRTPLIASDYASLDALKKHVKIVMTPATTNWGGLNEVPAHVEVSVDDFPGVNELWMSTIGNQELKDAAGVDATEHPIEAGERRGAAVWKDPRLVWYQGALKGINMISFVKGADKVTAGAIGRVTDAMAAAVTHRAPRPGTTAATQEAIPNMFLHVFGQALITTIWGRDAADFAGDIHERDQPALIVGGTFTRKTELQAIDNYCDMVNNIHGQAWGELASKSLGVDGDTVWTADILTQYVNLLQALITGSFGWKTNYFQPTHPEIVKLAATLNEAVHGTKPVMAPGTPAAKP
jgi:hypothetical protein